MAINNGKLTIHYQAGHPSPYENNGGTVVAIGGEGYVVLAADTRISSGSYIVSRTQKKVFEVTPKLWLASSGCYADSLGFAELVKYQASMYRFRHRKVISTNACSQMISVLLYHRRFFPYYVYNILAGLDAEGNGVVSNYDPIGSFQPEKYAADGTARAIVTPMLDAQLSDRSFFCKGDTGKPKILTCEEAVQLVTEAMHVAAERDVYTGDFANIIIIKKDDEVAEERTIPLKKD